jgi:hypothetical protein
VMGVGFASCNKRRSPTRGFSLEVYCTLSTALC